MSISKTIFLSLYNGLIFSALGVARVAAFFIPRVEKWLVGRQNWRVDLIDFCERNEFRSYRIAWFHCASLGEFEQGRAVIEGFRTQFPTWKIALTFFSASGFEVRKGWGGADLVFYLPADTPRNAADFLKILRPSAAVFVKYEFWPNLLFELRKTQTPTFLIAGLFRKGQPFFHPFGSFWREMLGCFDHIFLQNEASKELLEKIGFEKMTVVGDPRIDRVLAISKASKKVDLIEKFLKNERAIVCGSTWPEDEKLLSKIAQLPQYQRVKFIVAPHEVSEKRILEVEKAFPRAVFFSDEKADLEAAQILIVDSIGLLSSLYFYGKWAFIGGGFGAGIHNTLEPAAFGLPVVFGPLFEKFEEAKRLVAAGGFFSISDFEGLVLAFGKLGDDGFRGAASLKVSAFLDENRGATAAILEHFYSQFGNTDSQDFQD